MADVPSVIASGGCRVVPAVGGGMAEDGDALDTGLDVAGVGVDRVSICGATDSAVPVGALTKILVRPGSEPVQPMASASRDRITTAEGYPCLVLKGSL